jgi:NADH:ubiquinone oxidoreductase subunit B-like Fe-S oxidoreductase
MSIIIIPVTHCRGVYISGCKPEPNEKILVNLRSLNQVCKAWSRNESVCQENSSFVMVNGMAYHVEGKKP